MSVCAMPVTSSGYRTPVINVNSASSVAPARTSEARPPSVFAAGIVRSVASVAVRVVVVMAGFLRSAHAQGGETDVDQLDEREREHDASEPVDEQVAAEQARRRRGAILNAAQRQRDQ